MQQGDIICHTITPIVCLAYHRVYQFDRLDFVQSNFIQRASTVYFVILTLDAISHFLGIRAGYITPKVSAWKIDLTQVLLITSYILMPLTYSRSLVCLVSVHLATKCRLNLPLHTALGTHFTKICRPHKVYGTQYHFDLSSSILSRSPIL